MPDADAYQSDLTAIDNDWKTIGNLHQEAKGLLEEIAAIESFVRDEQRPLLLVTSLLRQVRAKYEEAAEIQKDLRARYDAILRQTSGQQ